MNLKTIALAGMLGAIGGIIAGCVLEEMGAPRFVSLYIGPFLVGCLIGWFSPKFL